jgi:glycosyltransferase involved in cell wall biosynthesis
MKILMITPFFPYPPHKNGVVVRTYNILKELSKKGHRVDLISYHEEKFESEHTNHIKKYINDISLVKRNVKNNIFTKLLNKFKIAPNIINNFYSEEMEETVHEKLNNNYDFIYCDQLSMAQFCKGYDGKKVLNANDLLSLYFKREYNKEKNLLRKINFWFESWKHKKYERNLYPRFNKVILVSDVDKREYDERLSEENSNLIVIPNGVDINYFNPLKTNVKTNKSSVVFTGIMDFPPNEKAVLSFYETGYKLLKKRGIKFYIVGKNPTNKIKRLAKNDENIIVTGFVDDIREYLVKGNIYICPLTSGAGIKNKLLEAMAMKKTIITTSYGSEGIKYAEDEVNMFIENNLNKMAEKAMKLISNDKANNNISINARKCVEKFYSWESIVNNLIRIIN